MGEDLRMLEGKQNPVKTEKLELRGEMGQNGSKVSQELKGLEFITEVEKLDKRKDFCSCEGDKRMST